MSIYIAKIVGVYTGYVVTEHWGKYEYGTILQVIIQLILDKTAGEFIYVVRVHEENNKSKSIFSYSSTN